MKTKDLSAKIRLSFIFLIIIVLTFSSYALSYQNTPNLIKKVEDAIGSYYDLNAENFQITNNNGEITIKGDVNSLYDKLRIFEIISDVKGVKKIVDNLNIQTDNVPDNIIKSNIEEELSLNNAILEPDSIKIEVDNGEVILSGTVSYYREKLMAQTIVSWQDGVVGFTNNINVLPYKQAVSDNNIKGILEEQLKDHYSLEKDVNISVSNGVVTLQGMVSSLWVKQNIEKDFFRVLGVNDIINLLKVKDYIG